MIYIQTRIINALLFNDNFHGALNKQIYTYLSTFAIIRADFIITLTTQLYGEISLKQWPSPKHKSQGILQNCTLKQNRLFLLSIYGEPGQVKCFQHKTNVLSEIKMSTFFTTASCRNTFQLTRVFLLKLAALSFKDFAHLNPNMFSHLSVIGNWNHGEPIVTFTGYSVIYRAATSVWN